MIEIPKNRLLF
ncbi:hypothetical protein CRE_09403 [Caenorhabditis remanei]|uniref:Uncharacterized protein n=1 Tax=Caenorhabditis remanei TaxID=31234 RepID=E3LIN8_CAERE|nr:hypothetical protein CRE_09403 [Caenorhabditis remanei]